MQKYLNSEFLGFTKLFFDREFGVIGLWAMDRVYRVRLMSLRQCESTRTLDLKICGPGLLSRRGMFQSDRDHLLEDGCLGIYEMVV
jgi:hypothetical protein